MQILACNNSNIRNTIKMEAMLKRRIPVKKTVRHTPNTEKRAFQRIPATIDFSCCKISCFGTITNLSVNGMFITSNNINFPFESQFEICIPLKNELLDVRVRIKRFTKSSGYYDGIGVELVNPPRKYMDLMSKLAIDGQSDKSFLN
jgi:hypothetical protein